MALDQPRSAVPPKAHSEVVKSELRKIDDEEVYDSLCKSKKGSSTMYHLQSHLVLDSVLILGRL